MKNRLCFSPGQLPRANKRTLLIAALAVLCWPARALAEAPSWMRALVTAPLPEHDEKTEAVVLYSETNVTVVSADKIRRQVREAYKVLRPEGRSRGSAVVFLDSHRRIKNLHGWCIPAQGKDYEVKDKDAVEVSPPGVEGGELVQDVKVRLLRIPAAEPGNIVGYEYEVEENPYSLQEIWAFHVSDPVRESHFSLQLPAGWEFKATWLNHSEIPPTQKSANAWEWEVTDIHTIHAEPSMPPFNGVRGAMIVSLLPSGGPSLNGFEDWNGMGRWYWNLTNGRSEGSDAIKQEVASLAAAKQTSLPKMQVLADFVQRQIRYVAIELGIGGQQPHAAAEVFANRYGDCKDKATLFRSMLHEIGIESYYVVIYNQRGAVTSQTPAYVGAFNHVIDAIRLPPGLSDPTLVATIEHPKLGKLLFFDPTDTITPFGQIRGALQQNYGLLVTPNGGELVELPKQPPSTNGIRRSAKLNLANDGLLSGEVTEIRVGDRAQSERYRLLRIPKDSDRIKPIEDILAGSLSNFRITHARLINLTLTDQPFGFDYFFESQNYAKNAGDMILLRPRVLGSKGRDILETKEHRRFPIEFEGPVLDTDSFEIAIPPGYVVDEIPPTIDSDYSFGSYHSKVEVTGNTVHYTRSFEIKELSVPVSKAEDLKKFYRIIAGDERNTVVLKATTK